MIIDLEDIEDLDELEIATDLPVLYEDESVEMGESLIHFRTEGILYYCFEDFFRRQGGEATVLPNMNLYYSEDDPGAYVSPDVMVVPVKVPANITSYRVSDARPVPFLVVEVLSSRTAQQGDLLLKPQLYAALGVQEYLLVDATAQFLKEKLLLKTRTNGGWVDRFDTGQGVESQYGFRIQFEPDGMIRLSNATSGRRHPRPGEVFEAFEEIERLKAEVAKLKSQSSSTNGHS